MAGPFRSGRPVASAPRSLQREATDTVFRKQLIPLALLHAMLLKFPRHRPPTAPPGEFAKPRFDAEIAYAEFTDDGMVRHPSFKRFVENQR